MPSNSGLTIGEVTLGLRSTAIARYGVPVRDILAAGPPFTRLRYWIDWARLRRLHIDQDNAVYHATRVVERSAEVLNVRLDRVWEQGRFDHQTQNMLAAGVACAGVGALIGSLFPGLGTLIGAVAGFVVGCFVGIVDFTKFDLYNDTRKFFDQLALPERYMHFQMYRALSDRARQRDGAEAFPPWRMDYRTGWDEFRNSSADTVYQLFKLLWERDSIPNDPAILPWALAAATVESQSRDEKLSDQWAYQKIVNDGKGSQWLKDAFQSNTNTPVGALQDAAIALGMNDYTTIPIPESVKNALLAMPLYGGEVATIS